MLTALQFTFCKAKQLENQTIKRNIFNLCLKRTNWLSSGLFWGAVSGWCDSQSPCCWCENVLLFTLAWRKTCKNLFWAFEKLNQVAAKLLAVNWVTVLGEQNAHTSVRNLRVSGATMRSITGVHKRMYVFVLQVCGLRICAHSLSISVHVWMSQCSTVWALFDELGIGSRWFVDTSLCINKAASSRSTESETAEREEKVRGVTALKDYRAFQAVTWGYTRIHTPASIVNIHNSFVR